MYLLKNIVIDFVHRIFHMMSLCNFYFESDELICSITWQTFEWQLSNKGFHILTIKKQTRIVLIADQLTLVTAYKPIRA